MGNQQFWLVWNERGQQAPRRKHPTEREARAEAERLARANPGETFHVLALIGSCSVPTVVWLTPGEIPF